MIVEAMRHLQSLAGGVVVRELADKRFVSIVKPDGSVEKHPSNPPDREHKTLTLNSFIDAVKRYAAAAIHGTSNDARGPDAVVWVGRSCVVAVLNDWDDAFRGDKITMDLSPSPIFGLLGSMNKDGQDQQKLLRLLRTTLGGVAIDPDVRIAIQSVRFATSDEQHGDLSPAKSDTMGRSIRAEVSSAAAIPESVFVNFPAFPLVDETIIATVSCYLAVLLQERLFVFAPHPGAIEAASSAAMEVLRRKINEQLGEVAVVLCGSP